MKTNQSITLCLLSILFCGCAAGRKIAYQEALDFTSPAYTQKLGVVVLDHRPYVINHDKTPQFVGLQRSLMGIPYGVHTNSGRSLAEDLSAVLVESLKKNGADAKSLTTATTTEMSALKDIENQPVDLGFVLFLNEWKTDSMSRLRFLYDVELKAVAKDGSVLAVSVQKGDEALANNNVAFGKGVADVFGRLFQTPEMQTLKVNSQPTSVAVSHIKSEKQNKQKLEVPPKAEVAILQAKPQGTCSVDQILKMKNMGLSDQQVSAACK